jgi:hypothetical protein
MKEILQEVDVFRLIRLALLALAGYAIYEFVQGLMRDARMGQTEFESGDSPRSPAGAIGAMTGPGKGQRVRTEDISGTGVTHFVGRGVV